MNKTVILSEDKYKRLLEQVNKREPSKSTPDDSKTIENKSNLTDMLQDREPQKITDK